MGVFYWQYDLDPEFPLGVLEYTTYGNQDKLHWHNYLQLALCVEGRGQYLFTNREYEIEQGDLFIIDNFETHVALSEPPDSVRFLFVIFLPELIASPGSSQFEFEYLSPFWYDANSYCNKIDHTNLLSGEIAQIMRQIQKIWNARQVGYRHMMDARLKMILAKLIEYNHTVDPQSTFNNIQSHVRMLPAINFIRDHYTEAISLEQASELVHVSASRFRHLFKEVTHMGFKEYIAVLRLAQAKKLLLTTDMTITDIANQVGYTNINQFYRIFYRHAFLSPADYRKKYQTDEMTVNEVFPSMSTSR